MMNMIVVWGILTVEGFSPHNYIQKGLNSSDSGLWIMRS
jgi:hypothetical protein